MACPRKRVRLSFDINFSSEEQKEAFSTKMSTVRKLLTPPGSRAVDNFTLFTTLFDMVPQQDHTDSSPTPTLTTKSFLPNSGIYKDCAPSDGEELFVTEKQCFSDLVRGLTSLYPSCASRTPWMVESITQKGHVIRVLFRCRRCPSQKRTWSSSRVLAGHYLVNLKMVHAFTCAGILPSQYDHMSQFAGTGCVGHNYIRRMYQKLGFIEVVGQAMEQSMAAAVDEVKALPEYTANKGEWVITDARHDSTANAYHTTVPCLSGSTKKILGISTISRSGHSVAQTRELECTKVVVPEVISRGLNVIEVAHDMSAPVAKYVTGTLKVINSYDTWHGTKNVSKELKKITEGAKRDREIKWFSELSDKRKSIKVHLYWAMKNCDSSPDKLQGLIMNVPNHYKGEHSNCHPSSPCHTPAYTPSKKVVTNPKAIESLTKQLQATYIYRYAKDFCRCRDTYWVESFNHQLLTYLPKRIHFSTTRFNMRMSLAVLDWNENVNRACTTETRFRDMRRPDRRTAMKVLVKKTFGFVASLWEMFVERNKIDFEEVVDESSGANDDDDDDESVMSDGEPVSSSDSDMDSDD